MPSRIDTESLKRGYPVDELITRYGIELRPAGRSLVGRCPFHPDGGRPNLYVYHASQSWYCFRCGIGGDVISFVERIEGLGFRDAVARIRSDQPRRPLVPPPPQPVRRPRMQRSLPSARGPAERACLAAAVELYHNRLLGDPVALAYVEGRGLDHATLERCRVGYASGDELVAYLRWHRLPARAAIRVGLLGRDGRERLAGRVVVPEIRAGQPVWLIGRALDLAGSGPKYLGLPGRKPLVGWEAVADSRTVYLVEGVFDWLTLLSWELPALALVGTHLRAEAVRALARFERVYVVLDNDEAGRAATAALVGTLGRRATPLVIPGVKDVAELAPRPDGRAIFTHTLQQSAHLQAA